MRKCVLERERERERKRKVTNMGQVGELIRHIILTILFALTSSNEEGGKVRYIFKVNHLGQVGLDRLQFSC